MALPVVHSLVGYALHKTFRNGEKSWWKTICFVFLANAADLDFLPGILVGKPLLFHHTITHSFAAACLCGLLASLVFKIFGRRPFAGTFFLASGLYASHLILDLFGPSPAMPLFWPFQPAGLAGHILTFQSLPLRCDGVKDFACGLLWNFSCVRRFWREMFCLGAALGFFIFRAAFRHLSVPVKRPAIFIRPPAACAD